MGWIQGDADGLQLGYKGFGLGRPRKSSGPLLTLPAFFAACELGSCGDG